MNILILFWLLVSCLGSVSYAQTDPIVEGSNIRPFTASGSIGIEASAYSVSGIDNRRAPSSFKSTANLDFSLFGLSSGLNLLYSTDQSQLRQNLNNFSFNATWNWLTVQAGDVSPNFSEYGLNGVTIRGGELELNPGNWRVQLSGGRSKRRVPISGNDGFRQPSFERWTVAGRVGYESQDDSYFFLSSQYSVDEKNSLENAGTLTPQENLTVTPDAQVTFLNGRLRFASQVTFSAYTRDLNTPKVPLSDIGLPSFLSNVIQAHSSSRINYAGQASATFDLENIGLELGYKRIQPGFMSLGVGRVRDDQQQISISPSIQLFGNKVQLQSSIALTRDNLLDSRLLTQRNSAISTNAQIQLSEWISINTNYNLLINDLSSDGPQDTTTVGLALGQRQVAHTITLQPSLTFQNNAYTHTVSVAGSFYTFANTINNAGASVPRGLESETYSSSLTYSLTFPIGLAINTMGNYLNTNSGTSETSSIGANIGSSYSFFERKLSVSLNGGFNQNSTESIGSSPSQPAFNIKSRQLMLNLTSSYRLTSKDSFSLSVRARQNEIVTGSGSTFTELEGSFNYKHHF